MRLNNKVVKQSDDRLSVTFGALADPTRRAILSMLADGEATVTELTAPFPISMPAISRHLKVLEQAELIARSRSGQHLTSALRPAPLLRRRPNGWSATGYSGAPASIVSTFTYGGPSQQRTEREKDVGCTRRCIRSDCR